MTLSATRLSMMDKFKTIPGVNVPDDPLPKEIDDKTIVVFPRIEQSGTIAKGRTAASISVQVSDVMRVEYHRRVPYEHLGSTMGDITAMIDSISEVVWKEHAGGKFDGTILGVNQVALVHFGELGWNEWTFGARLEVTFTHLNHVVA